MDKIIDRLVDTFKAGERKGISSRKITAFVIMVLVVTTHIIAFTKQNFLQYIIEILLADYAMIAALFGLTTYESQKIRSTKNNTTNSESIT